jgi:MFS family permease
MQSRNYRLFFIGQTLSLIGTWMQNVAIGWFVYRITNSAALLGVVTFAQQIPMLLVSPFAGVVTDRVNKRNLLVITQSLQAIQALAMTALAIWGVGNLAPWVLLLSAFMGVVGAFDTPGRQSFVIEMIEDRNLLPNAIALNSTQFNLARLIGPIIAGFTIRLTNEATCFFINAISFLAVIVGLLLMQIKPKPESGPAKHPWHDFLEGARYVRANGPILSLLALLFLMSFVSGFYQVLLPVFAKNVFSGDSTTLGFLTGAVGVGALVSAGLLASRESVVGLLRWIWRASTVFSLSLLAFALTQQFWMGLVILPFVGVGMMMQMGGTNTLVQTLVDDKMRGRVMAFYAMSFVGSMPLGSLASGLLSARIGPHVTLLLAGAIGIGGSTAFALLLPRLRAQVRPVYISKGILQEDPA